MISVEKDSGDLQLSKLAYSHTDKIMHSFRLTFLALAAALVASCASPGPIGTAPNIELAGLNELPTPNIDEAAVVRPRDTLRIAVFGFPDLSRELQVNSSGSFQFPLIGIVEADGRTPLSIARDIATRLRGAYVVDPEVTVDSTEQPGRLFTMGGQVQSPGRYPVLGSMSLLDAVATGGGSTDTAVLNEVLIFRTVEGQRYIGVYDLGAIQRGNYEDPAIYPGDTIQVGDSPTLRRIQALAPIISLFTTPLILLERVLR